MKLILAIISNEDASSVSNALKESSFYSTKLATTGGFLSKGNTTLIIGVEENKVNEALDIIKEHSKTRTEFTSSTMFTSSKLTSFPLEVKVGGATVFVLDVEQFLKF